MAGEVKDTVWPMPKFYFEVELGGPGTVPFREVSGLEAETEVTEYSAGGSKVFSPIKMPGISKVGNVTLKKGIFVNDNRFWTWFSETKMNTIKRQTVAVSLLDETGEPKMIWTLANAFPTKVIGTDLKSDGNEVAVDTVEIAYEQMKITNA